MYKIVFSFKLCFVLTIISILICFLYISTLNEYVDLKSGDNNLLSTLENQDFDNSVERALEILIDTVGTIPNFIPKQLSSCPKFPPIMNLQFNNDIWQMLETSNGTFYLFGAYYDDRKKNSQGPSVRLIGMINRIDPTVQTICQLWYKDAKPIEVPVDEYKLIWLKAWGLSSRPGTLYPYLITCQVPENVDAPDAVSLVEFPCDSATNNLVINNNYITPEVKQDFVVCVKGLDFPFDDISVRLVEWIELLKLFGADKIVFYNLESHPNIEKVLDFYSSNFSNFVEVRTMTLAGRQLNFGHYQHYYLHKRIGEKRLNELVAYNDCFYQNMYEYKYVVLLDIDEVIVPTIDTTWQELIQRIKLITNSSTYSSFSSQNVYFLDILQHEHDWHEGIPKEMHMLQHLVRTKNFTKPNHYVKCFHDTEEIVTLHNHFPFSCFTFTSTPSCNHYTIDKEIAQLNHYREDCQSIPELKTKCPEMKMDSVVDETLWRFKDLLVQRVVRVAKQLELTIS